MLLHHGLHVPLPGSLLALHGSINTDIVLYIGKVILLGKGGGRGCAIEGHLWPRISGRLHLRKSWILVLEFGWYRAYATTVSLHVIRLSMLLKFLGIANSHIISGSSVDLVAWPIRAPYRSLMDSFLLPL